MKGKGQKIALSTATVPRVLVIQKVNMVSDLKKSKSEINYLCVKKIRKLNSALHLNDEVLLEFELNSNNLKPVYMYTIALNNALQ